MQRKTKRKSKSSPIEIDPVKKAPSDKDFPFAESVEARFLDLISRATKTRLPLAEGLARVLEVESSDINTPNEKGSPLPRRTITIEEKP